MSKGGMIFLAILFFLIAIVGNIAINGFIVWVIWDVVLVRVIQSIQPISFWLCSSIPSRRLSSSHNFYSKAEA